MYSSTSIKRHGACSSKLIKNAIRGTFVRNIRVKRLIHCNKRGD